VAETGSGARGRGPSGDPPEASARPSEGRGRFVSGRFLWVLAVGALVYIALAFLQSSDLDEGGYLLAAVQIAHGQLPFVNFVGIEPVVPYYLSLGVLLFGPSLLVARLQLVVLVLATSAGIYSIGRSQHSEGAGLLASGLFLFSPLALYYNSIVILEAASLAPLVFAMLLLLRPSTDRPLLPSIAIGILLGIAVLTRRDTALLVPLFLVAMTYRHRTGHALKAGLGVVTGVALPVGSVLGYFTLRTSVAWMNAQYGLGAAYAASTLSLPFHVGVLAYGVLTLPALALGLTGVGAWCLRGLGWPTSAKWTLRVAGVPLLAVLALGLNFESWGQGESLFAAVAAEFVILVVLWLALRLVLADWEFSSRSVGVVTGLFLLAWLGLVLLFFTFVYPTFFVHYLIEATAPASLLVGIYLADLIGRAEPGRWTARLVRRTDPRRENQLRRAVVVGVVAAVLVVPSVTGAGLVLGPFNSYNNPYANDLPAQNLYQRVYPLSEIQQVANYVDSHSETNATVFTADSIFAAAADRLVLLNLSTVIDDYAYPPTSLGMNESPLGFDPYGLAPTLSQLFSAWNRTYVPFVIVGNKTLSFESATPYLARYLDERYHPVAVFDPGLLSQEVVIEGRGASSGAATLADSVPLGAAPAGLAVDALARVAFIGEAGAGSIEVANESGSHYTVTLPSDSPGVTSLEVSPDDSTLVATTSEGNLVVYNVSSTGGLSLRGEVDLPGPVSSWASWTSPDLVYADIASHAEVVAFDTATLEITQTFATGPGPSAVAVSDALNEMAVVSLGESVVGVYNLTTGQHEVDYGLGPRTTDSIVFEGQQLVGIQNLPGEVFWVNLTTGEVGPVDALTGTLGGWDSASGQLAVGDLTDGTVSFFNATTAAPIGSIETSSCPQFVGEGVPRHEVWTVGACHNAALLWSLSVPVPLSLNVGPGTHVTLNGLSEPASGISEVLPGTYVLRATGGGAASITLVTANGPVVVNITAPSLAVSWAEYQAIFFGISVVGATAAIFGILWLGVRRRDLFLAAGPVGAATD